MNTSYICQVCKAQEAKFSDDEKILPTHCEECRDINMVNTRTHQILLSHHKTYGTAHLQLDSYNNLITFGLQRIVNETPEIVVNGAKGQRFVYSFGHLFVENPKIATEDRTLRPLLPSEARLRDLCYESAICVDITSQTYENDNLVDTKLNQRVIIGYIPTMLKSVICNLSDKSARDMVNANECMHDQGGYFIINGKERVIIFQVRPAYNFVQVIEQALTTSTKYKYIAEVRSVAEESGYSVLVQSMFSMNGKTIFFSLPNIKEPIPAGIVFKALGILDSEEIKKMIGMKYEKGEKYVKYILYESAHITNRDDAIAFIGKHPMYVIQKEKQTAYAKQIVEMELFPHLGITATLTQKAEFLGYMVHKLISTIIGVRKDDDRDNISNKRVETSGALIGDLFRAVFGNYVKNLALLLQKNTDIISHINKSGNYITKNIQTCFSTGNWGSKKSNHIKQGVSQVLDRMTFSATLSHLRRCVITTGKDSKNEKIRQIHTSQFGFICPAETPEGAQCGIVSNLAMLTRVSRKISTVLTKETILGCETISDTGINVLVNGVIIANTEEPDLLIEEIIELRKNKLIDRSVSAVFDSIDNEIRILCDEGRLLRPVFIVRDGKIYDGYEKSWDQLVEEGYIQYLDTNEIENSVIAMTPAALENSEYTYDACEIDPYTILGVCASIIPYPDHSQSPRNCYQSSMAKQALGVPLLTYNQRADTTIHVLDYPQRPLVSTNAAKMMGFNDMPSGQAPIVAILAKEGFNQEDSIILNKGSIDRGLFRVTTYFTIADQEARNSSKGYQTIEIPPVEIQRKDLNYSFLETTGPYAGIVKKGYHLKKDDVVIGKIFTKTGKDKTEERATAPKTDVSVAIKTGDEGIVHNVILTTTPEGHKMVKIVLRVIRIPEIGDKFASRAAQKGTCGMIFGQEDMPFTSQGITPDMIINPHCIPSRMTINQLMETLQGKTCAMKGKFGNATPFSSSSTNVVDRLCDELESAGYERHGYESLFDPYTGKKIDAKVFIGPTYYQRLKHLVSDKMHSRAKGQVTSLTHQPVEGRSRDGGLRFGEMERDCVLSTGASRLMKERLFDMSDPYSAIVCSLCGQISTSQTECKICKEDKLCAINIPYAAKLLFQELNALGVKIELIPKK
jgi:DNA-directed RNA polymerase II subunit RPB2